MTVNQLIIILFLHSFIRLFFYSYLSLVCKILFKFKKIIHLYIYQTISKFVVYSVLFNSMNFLLMSFSQIHTFYAHKIDPLSPIPYLLFLDIRLCLFIVAHILYNNKHLKCQYCCKSDTCFG